MSSKKPLTATDRLKQDLLRLRRDPIPYVTAEPLHSNMLEWHFVVTGPEKSPYEGGMYHGKLIFPRDFPFKPPSIYMMTPNGRFKTNTKLCLSISDYHPDTWNPAWSVSTILTGLLSFMLEKSPTYGSIETSDYEKRQLAYHSLSHNIKDHQFCQIFPEIVQLIDKELERRKNEERVSSGSSSPNGDPLASICPKREEGALANLCIILAVAVFVYAVKYVISTTYIDKQDSL